MPKAVRKAKRKSPVQIVGPIPANVRAVKGHNKPPRKTKKFNAKTFVPDPINDSFVHGILQMLIGHTASEIARRAADIAKAANDPELKVCAGTICKWRRDIKHGGTRFPSTRTARAALATVGKKLEIK